ncbi:uncharacterized protein Hap1MRO34_018113 [Clarias gariepinus]
MEELDDVAVSILRAANITETMMSTLSREDLRDLFPGPENFIRRKAVWRACHGASEEESGQEHSKLSGISSFNASPMQQTSTPVKASPAKYTTPEKVVKLSFPEYVLHTDTELEQVRQQYFELSKRGEQRDCQMSKELRCRLIRNTMTSMIAILRAKGDRESHRYPSKPEITAMAKRIVLYYPMLQDQGLHTWFTVYRQLYKRLQNVRSPQKTNPDGRHSKSSTKRRCLEQSTDTDEMGSSDSTIILDLSTEESGSPRSDGKESELEGKRRSQSLPEEAPSTLSSPDANKSADVDSPDTSSATLAKHYKTLHSMYKRKNPNHQDVSHLLDLEFVARRAFIDSNTVREENRHEKVLEAYPCFKDVGHVMEELKRILDAENTNFINELKGRWC